MFIARDAASGESGPRVTDRLRAVIRPEQGLRYIAMHKLLYDA